MFPLTSLVSSDRNTLCGLLGECQKRAAEDGVDLDFEGEEEEDESD